jgi:4a-hydroxytetrahydrobiopterin dehydratase
MALTKVEIDLALEKLPLWRMASGRIVREWVFADFVRAMSFVNRVAGLAEAAGHHPDVDIRYNKVTLGLVTHDAGGVTSRDIAMAHQLDTHFAD